LSERQTAEQGPDRAAPPRRRRESAGGPESAQDRILALQRKAGNGAVLQVLREPGGTVAREPTGLGGGVRDLIKKYEEMSKPGAKQMPGKGTETTELLGGAGTAGASSATTTADVTAGETAGAAGGAAGPSSGIETADAPGTRPAEAGAGTAESTGGLNEAAEGLGGGARAGTAEAPGTAEKSEPGRAVPLPLPVTVDAMLRSTFDSLKGSNALDNLQVVGQKQFDERFRSWFGRTNTENVQSFKTTSATYVLKDTVGLSSLVQMAVTANRSNNFLLSLGSQFSEGTGAILTQAACRKFNLDAPAALPEASSVVQAALDAGLPFADLVDAYFNGGAKQKIAAWVDAHCRGDWEKVKGYLEGYKLAANYYPGGRFDLAKSALRRMV
jgi:hypothetical protein